MTTRERVACPMPSPATPYRIRMAASLPGPDPAVGAVTQTSRAGRRAARRAAARRGSLQAAALAAGPGTASARADHRDVDPVAQLELAGVLEGELGRPPVGRRGVDGVGRRRLRRA